MNKKVALFGSAPARINCASATSKKIGDRGCNPGSRARDVIIVARVNISTRYHACAGSTGLQDCHAQGMAFVRASGIQIESSIETRVGE